MAASPTRTSGPSRVKRAMTERRAHGEAPAVGDLIDRILALDEEDEIDLVIDLVDGRPRIIRQRVPILFLLH